MLSSQATSLIPQQFIIPLPQKHNAILFFLTIWIKQTLGNITYRKGYQTSAHAGDGNPSVSLGVTKGNNLFFYPSPLILECCYCNLILQYSLLKESTHMITLHRLQPQACGAACSNAPSKLAHECSKQRNPKLPISKPCPQPGNGAASFQQWIYLQYQLEISQWLQQCYMNWQIKTNYLAKQTPVAKGKRCGKEKLTCMHFLSKEP